MKKRTLAEQLSGRCKHFTGIQHAECKMNINYEELVGGNRFGIGKRIPCIARNETDVQCTLLAFLTPEEVKAEEDEIQAELAKMLEKMASNVCPHCDKPIEEYQQVGRCVYANPCGHRQYQGKVPSDRPSIIVEEYPDWDDI